MPDTAIVFTTNRVIRRLTSDPTPFVAADETAIQLGSPLDLSGGPWKLDVGNNKVAATAAEAQAAGTDHAFQIAQRQQRMSDLLTACDNVINDASIPNANIKTFAAKLKAFLS